MRKKRAVRIRRRRRRQDEESMDTKTTPARGGRQPEQLGPHYSVGPVYELGARAAVKEMGLTPSEEQETGAPRMREEAEQRATTVASQEQMPTLEGEGEPEHAVAFNRRGPLRLQGRTDADFDGGSFRTQNVTVRTATGCARPPCIRVTGTLVATYAVRTRVTLPRLSDFQGLTPCQQRRVQDAIDNVLAPHEQKHVQAFETYNGTTQRAFDLKINRSEFENAIREMFEAEERARQQAARAASAALDPFHFDADLDCEEPEQSGVAPDVAPAPEAQE